MIKLQSSSRLFCLILLFFSNHLPIYNDISAQVKISHVSGIVADARTGAPLQGANVVYGDGRGTVTGGDGRFHFQANSGKLRVVFRYVGYREEVRELELTGGEDIELKIPMFVQATEIDRVVITAGRAEQRLADLTVSVSLIKQESIQAAHTTDAQELMNKTPGIEVLDGQASIRGGSGYSYGAGSRVMVLIDGLPMLSADAGHVRWQSLPFENLSQVEIIKGASSVMYGSSALNGIINFRTAEATSEGVTRFFIEPGIFGNPRSKEWIWWNSPRVFSGMSVSHLKKYGNTDIGAGFFMHIENGYRARNEDNVGRINFLVRRRSKKVSGLTYGVSLNAMHSRKQDFILWEDGITGALKQDISTAQQLLGYSLALDPIISLKRGKRFTHDLRTRLHMTRNDFPDGGQNNSDAVSLFSEYQFRYMISRYISLNTGVMQHSSKIFSPFYGNHKSSNTGGYAQADITPFNRLKLVTGMRLENYSLDGLAEIPVPLFRAGVNYRFFRSTFIRASFGQGHRYPSIAEKHAATTLGAVRIFPNPSIRAESGWNSEIAVKQGISTKYFTGLADIALFYTQNKDMIEYVFSNYYDPVNQVSGRGFRATNIEFSRVYGVETEFIMHTQIRKLPITINGGYLFMYPVEYNIHTGKNTGKYLKFRRKHALNLSVSTVYRKVEINIHSSARSAILDIDDVFLNPLTREEILPGFYDYWDDHNFGYFMMDAAIAYPITDKYRLSLALKNITNTEYMGRPGDIRPHRHFCLRFTGVI